LAGLFRAAQHHYGGGPWTVAEDFGVASGETIFIPLVEYGEARDPRKYPCGDTLFELLPAAPGSPKFDVGKEYVPTLRATSPRSRVVKKLKLLKRR
jgi:hypothetical protein